MEEFEQCITVQEAAERLNRSEHVIWRMLERGKLPAMLSADLKTKDGTSLGFDYALLPPEGVARVLHQGGDELTLKWTYALGNAEATCQSARRESIRVLWEPALFPDVYSLPDTQAAKTESEQATPAEAGAPEIPGIAPAQSTATPAPMEIAFEMVATRQQLIDAFGKFTGMSLAWFTNLKDSPKLKAARKYAGRGGRHNAEPLFCPYEVMQWLADPKLKKRKSLNEATAWRLLKGHFPKVYNLHSINDPNAD